MIDLHTHSLLSDGLLLPSELARRYREKGYKAIAITDHVDASNIKSVTSCLVEFCHNLPKDMGIKVVPGLELTHVHPAQFKRLIKYARSKGIRLILIHGETIVEPVIPGTNQKALECDIDILAHPGLISKESARLAAEKDIYLEITTRRGHSLTNGHIVRLAKQTGAKIVLNTDSHSPEEIIPPSQMRKISLGAGLFNEELTQLFKNSEELLKKCLTFK